MRRPRAALVAGLAASIASAAQGATEPSHPVTRVQGEMAFSLAVVMSCLTAQQQQRPIAELDPIYRTGLLPAEGDDLKMGDTRLPPGRTWISRLLGSHLLVVERGADRCEVIADQLPVEETLQRTLTVTTKLDPPFTPEVVHPGYNPVVLESSRVVSGRRFVVHLEGAEPGLPGHWSRFALLQAVVTNAPAPAP